MTLYDRHPKLDLTEVDWTGLRQDVIRNSDQRDIVGGATNSLIAAVQNAGVKRFDRWVVFGFTDEADVRAWLTETVKPWFGWSFHPDTDVRDGYGLTGVDADVFQRCIDEAFDLAVDTGFDLYGLCVDVLVPPNMTVVHNPDGTTDLDPKEL